jgi:hypothetical protein
MELNKSIDFLLENAGAVIQYRLRKEILKNITPSEEEYYLGQIYQTPYFKLVESYAKSNGFIGVGMHGHTNWRGVKLHETPLQDGESAARLLSHYAIPKSHPLVSGFISAMRDDDVMREEFSYNNSAKQMFEHRFIGLCNGGGLMAIVYTLQSMLGYGDDDYALDFQDMSLSAFRSLLYLSSLDQILKYNPNLKREYNYPYIEADTYFPCQYHLTTLAHTKKWRTPANIRYMIEAINYMDEIMAGADDFVLKIKNKYIGALGAFNRPFTPFSINSDENLSRRFLTEIAMLGVGKNADVIRISAEAVEEALSSDGVLRLNYASDKQRRNSMTKYAYAYGEIGLEPDHRKKTALD